MAQKYADLMNFLGADLMNQILGVTRQQPNMRYMSLEQQRFCWTTERTSDSKYWALLYRVRKDGVWVLKKKRAFKHRAAAKRCAKRWKERADK